MLTKNQIKRIASLKQKKARQEEKLFVAEGEKLIAELVAGGLNPEHIYAVEGQVKATELLNHPATTTIPAMDMSRISGLTTPSSALAIFRIPEHRLDASAVKEQLVVALDSIQDPGNLGTIIRLCVWFGVSNLVCSTDTVDCYNAKVVQASMGALSQVKVHYTNLSYFLSTAKASGLPIFGTFLDGDNIYRRNLPSNGILVMGNEGNGISPEIESLISNKLNIPSFATAAAGAESLNVATATAIALSEFRRGTAIG